MNMITKIKDKFSGEVYDILGKPRTEPIALSTIYFTDKYWIQHQVPIKGLCEHHVYRMGHIGELSQIASAVDRDRQVAYDEMIEDFTKLRNRYN